MAMGSPRFNPSTIQLLKQAVESHVSPYLNNAYTDHECFSLVVPNELSIRNNEVFYLLLSHVRSLLWSSQETGMLARTQKRE